MTIIGEAYVAIAPEMSSFAPQVEQEASGLLGTLGPVFAGIGVLAVGAGAGLAALGDQFETAYATIARRTGQTGAALDGLDQSFKNVLSTAYGATFSNTSDALSTLAQRTGLTGAALEQLTRQEIDLGTITKTDVGANVSATSELFGQFGVSAQNMSTELNVLFKASQVSGGSITDLESTMKSITPISQALGLTFNQTAALTANLEKLGLPATKVMQGLGAEFAKAAKAGKDPISVIQDLIAQIKAAPDPTEAATIATANFGIGARQAASLVAGLRSGALDLGGTLAQITSGQGGIESTAAATATFGEKLDLLKNKAAVALEPLAMRAIDVANAFLDVLPGALSVVGGAFESLASVVQPILADLVGAVEVFVGSFTGKGSDAIIPKGVANAVIQFGADARAAFDAAARSIGQLVDFYGPRLVSMWHGVVDVWNSDVYPFLRDQLLPIIKDVGDWLRDHWQPVLAATAVTLGLLVSPAATLAVVFALLYEKSKTFRDIVDDVGRALRATFLDIVHVIQNDVAPRIAEFVDFFTERWGKIQTAFETVLTAVKVFLAVTLGPMILLWKNFHDQILAIVQFAWAQVQNIVETFVRILSDAFDLIISILSGKWGDAWNDVMDIFSAAFGFMRDTLGNLLDLVVSFFSSLPGNILNALGDLASVLVPAAESLIGGLLSGITTAFVAVATWFVNLPVVILGLVASIGGWLITSGVNLLEGLLAGIVEGDVAVVNWFLGLPAAIVGLLADAGTWLLQTGVSVITGLIYGIVSEFGQLPGALAGIYTSVTNAVSNAATWLLDAGSQVVQGLINGLEDAIKNIPGTIAHMGGAVVDGFKSALGIGSPSKVFMGLGGNVIEGLVQGLRDGAPAASQAVDELAAGLAGRFPITKVGAAGTLSAGTAAAASAATSAQLPPGLVNAVLGARPPAAGGAAVQSGWQAMLDRLDRLVALGEAGQTTEVRIPASVVDHQKENIASVLALRNKQVMVGR